MVVNSKNGFKSFVFNMAKSSAEYKRQQRKKRKRKLQIKKAQQKWKARKKEEVGEEEFKALRRKYDSKWRRKQSQKAKSKV